MYKPREDSFLILKHIKKYIDKNSRVLDMGTGSAILAMEAAKKAKKVVAIDINKNLIAKHKKENKNKKIKFISSDLFSNIKGNFDLIIFNPPYLPSEKTTDIALDGGKNGTETIERFLEQAKGFLTEDGKILIICSSLNKDIEKLFIKYSYRYKLLDQENFFFEKIFLYELS